jgi:hypothetical protein
MLRAPRPFICSYGRKCSGPYDRDARKAVRQSYCSPENADRCGPGVPPIGRELKNRLRPLFQTQFQRDFSIAGSSFGGQRSIQLSYGFVAVHLADWPEVGNGLGGLGRGRSKAREAKVTRSNRVGCARKACAERAGTVAARFTWAAIGFASASRTNPFAGSKLELPGNTKNLFALQLPTWRDDILERVEAFPRGFDRSDAPSWNINGLLGERQRWNVARAIWKNHVYFDADNQLRSGRLGEQWIITINPGVAVDTQSFRTAMHCNEQKSDMRIDGKVAKTLEHAIAVVIWKCKF